MTKTKGKVITDYTEGNILRQMLIFAVPFMLSALLQNLYSMVDSIVVGQFVGSAGLSGVITSSQITAFVTQFVMGLASAGQVMISQYIGAREISRIRRTLGTLFTSTFIFALVLTLACLVFTDGILDLMNVPQEAHKQARDYLVISSFGFVFVTGYNAASAILRGSGDSKRPFIIVATTSVCNLVLDLLFVAVLKMEAAGAALATVISQAVSMAVCTVIFYRNREEYNFDFRFRSFIPDLDELKLLLKLGVPLAIKSAALTISNLFVSSHINAYGVAASAAYGVGRKLEMLPTIFTMGLYNAGTAMIGQNLGAQKYDRIKSIVRIMLCVACVCFAVFIVVFQLFPYTFFSIFTTDAAVLDYAPVFMKVLIVTFVGNALMCPYYSVIIGIGHSNLNLAISMFDAVVLRIGLGLLFGSVLGMGVVGFYLGSACAVFGTAIPSMVYYFSGRWKNRSLVRK